MRGVRQRIFRALTLRTRPLDTTADKHIQAVLKNFRVRNIETMRDIPSRVATPSPPQPQRMHFSARA
jgi:hypothetical protein